MDHRKRTPLLKAARHNSSPIILKLLLESGARPDIADDEGNTPFHVAAIRGTAEVGRFLLELGANPYARNRKGFVAYELAVREDLKLHFQVCPICLQASPGHIQCNHC
mmetsp:Transcript_5853/g.5284  ORF Transcript_5853/g.5284 Transcript_5853/m.5284 type:complete len:108 (+) Transcript_5853:3-326(+)